MKTLIVPSLNGQADVFTSQVLPYAEGVDKVIQTGNIIGRGQVMRAPGQKTADLNARTLEAVLDAARRMSWVQLIGLNEVVALSRPGELNSEEGDTLLRVGWAEGLFRTAYADHDRLFTHGGLTYGHWVQIGSPGDAQAAADALNQQWADTLYPGPGFALGDPPYYSASPIVADCAGEFLASWVTAPVACPFDQVNGSVSLQSPAGQIALNDGNSPARYVDSYQFSRTGSTAWVRGARFTSLDLGLPDDKPVKSLVPPFRLYVEQT